MQSGKMDEQQENSTEEEEPWKNSPNYFTNVRVSAVAILKMVTHAHSGGNIEIMGLMQGRVESGCFVITDSFPVPVEGTETRVNAGEEAMEYMVTFQECSEQMGRPDNICGWYHSHPGYGCWLSGIDVETQLLHQQHQDPFLAIVIDPFKTSATGKVDIGAFRCYPRGYEEPETTTAVEPSGGGRQALRGDIPDTKLADFGLHHKRYYSLTVSIDRSAADSWLLRQLWSSYWKESLSSPLVSTNSREDATKLGALLSASTHRQGLTAQHASSIADQALRHGEASLRALTSGVVKERLFGRSDKKLADVTKQAVVVQTLHDNPPTDFRSAAS
eukprot:GHVS01082439.1.p1 GENE.GHVS01082439.1~~GHVS01082439.1.p1  ORF type:complete len:331 (+),score=46.93 GHVS01082439.1:61-1053(+)